MPANLLEGRPQQHDSSFGYVIGVRTARGGSREVAARHRALPQDPGDVAMGVLGLIFLVLLGIAVVVGLIVFAISVPSISRYTRIRKM
jgi:hypothetical protein